MFVWLDLAIHIQLKFVNLVTQSTDKRLQFYPASCNNVLMNCIEGNLLDCRKKHIQIGCMHESLQNAFSLENDGEIEKIKQRIQNQRLKERSMQ